MASFQNHASDAGVERQFGQLHADGREFVGVVNCAEFIEQLVAIGNGFGARRFYERKPLHIAQMQRLHAQNHPSQRAAQNFRIGEFGAAIEIHLVV